LAIDGSTVGAIAALNVKSCNNSGRDRGLARSDSNDFEDYNWMVESQS